MRDLHVDHVGEDVIQITSLGDYIFIHQGQILELLAGLLRATESIREQQTTEHVYNRDPWSRKV